MPDITLPTPGPGGTPGPQYAEMINTAISTVNTAADDATEAVQTLPRDFVSVRGYDSRGDSALQALSGTATDAGPMLNNIAGQGYDKITITGDYTIATTFDLPASLRWLNLENATLRYASTDEGATPMLQRRGSISWLEDIPAMAEGDRTFATTDVSKYTSGDFIKLGGENYPANAPVGNRYGWMRQVRSVVPTGSGSAGTVTLDFPIPRKLDANPHVFKYSLAPSFRLEGDSGSQILGVGYRAPIVDFEEYIAKFYYVDGVQITGDMLIGKHSRSCIMLSDVNGGLFDSHITDIWDQSSGYGINLVGATREFVVLGTVNRVRHAVTTNTATPVTLPGPGGVSTAYGAVGEPELNWMAPVATNCTNKALDTHRLGWGNTMVPNVNGGFGGVTVRADATNILGGTILNSLASGITVSSGIVVPAKITGVLIDGVNGGDGLTVLGPAEIADVTVRRVFSSSYAGLLSNGPSTVVSGFTATDMKYAIRDAAGNLSVDGLDTTNVETPYLEAGGRPQTAITRVARKDGFVNLVGGGRWFAPSASAWAVGSFNAGVAFGERITLPAGTITDMQISCTTAGAGANVRLALYSQLPNGLIKLVAEATRLADGTLVPLDCSTTGLKTATFASPIIQKGGTYWLSVRTQGAAASYQRATVIDDQPSDTISAPLSSARVASTATGLVDGSAFPDTFYPFSATGQPIAIGIRVVVT